MYQLIYTSAPRLLEAGKTGFGTLARSKDMPQPLVSYMERLSTFDRAAGIRALQFYSFFSQGSLMYHVFSRVADAGADYTGRTNHLAQHFAIECGTAEDMAAQLGTPAGILLALGPLWLRECDYQPRILDEADMPGNAPTSPTGAWLQLTGTPGCEKWLARHAYRNGACLRFREPADTQTFLKLMHDAQLCMPTKGWGRGFSSATVSNLSAQLFPVTALDTRQQAAGITCPPGCPALDIMPGMQPPPAQDDQPAPPPTPEQRSKPIPQVSAPPHAAPIPMETIGGEVETVLPVHPAAPGHPLPPGHAPSRTAPARQALKGKTGTTRERKSGLPVPLLIVGGLAAGALCAVLFQGKSDKPAKPTRPDTAETSSTKEEIKKQDSSRSKLAEDYAKNTRPTQQEEQDSPAPTPQTQPSRFSAEANEPADNVAKVEPLNPRCITIEIPKHCDLDADIPRDSRKFHIKDDCVTGTFVYLLRKSTIANLAPTWCKRYPNIFVNGDDCSAEISVKFKVKCKDSALKTCREREDEIGKFFKDTKDIQIKQIAIEDKQIAIEDQEVRYIIDEITDNLKKIKNNKQESIFKKHSTRIDKLSITPEHGKRLMFMDKSSKDLTLEQLKKLANRVKKIANAGVMTQQQRLDTITESMDFDDFKKNKFKVKLSIEHETGNVLELTSETIQP